MLKTLFYIRLFALQWITYTLQQDVDSTCAWVDQNLLLLNTIEMLLSTVLKKTKPTAPQHH